MTLIAEDLLLLLLDDDSGTLPALWVDVDVPLGAAVLAELAIDGDVELAGDGVWQAPALTTGAAWEAPIVTAAEGAEERDPVLADALAVIRERPRTSDDLAWAIGDGLKERLADRLVDGGVLERQEDRVLGVIPRTRWPAVRTTGEAAVRDALRAALLDGAVPSDRDSALIGILQALDRVPQTFGLHGDEARAARERAAELAEGDWASRTVRDAIAAMLSATSTGGIATGGLGPGYGVIP